MSHRSVACCVSIGQVTLDDHLKNHDYSRESPTSSLGQWQEAYLSNISSWVGTAAAVEEDVGLEHNLFAREYIKLDLTHRGTEGHVLQLLSRASTSSITAAAIVPRVARETDLDPDTIAKWGWLM